MVHHLLRNAAHFHIQRRQGWALRLPWSYTVSVLSGCNAHCRTCNIHRVPDVRMTLQQCRALVRGVHQPAGWLTVSGGEPFLHGDLAQLVDLLVQGLGPRLINIPTNGSLPGRVGRVMAHLVRRWPRRQFIVNVSLDGVGIEHDQLRGLPGSYERALRTLAQLRQLAQRVDNLTVGIHTVVSRYNVARFAAICDQLLQLDPDSYVMEVAENRVELGTLDQPILPDAAGFARAVRHLQHSTAGRHRTGLTRLIGHLRRAYYDDVLAQLQGRARPRRCFAGSASCHVLADGTVLACGVRGWVLGHLERHGGDLAALWRSPEAAATRRQINAEGCRCPLANQAYVNLALDPRALLQIGARALVSELGQLRPGRRQRGRAPGGQP